MGEHMVHYYLNSQERQCVNQLIDLCTDRSMLQDPTVFPEPSEFKPERYLNEDGSLRELARHEDPSLVGFGFGRRYVRTE